MSDFLSEYEEQPDSNELSELSKMVELLIEQRRTVSLMEENLKKEKEKERKLSEDDIPSFMSLRGLKSLTTEKGFKVEVKEDLKAYLPKNDVEKSIVLKWIIENGGESIIKDQIIIEEPEEKVKIFLKENGIPFLSLKDIHNRTLVSFLKGLLGLSKGSLQEVEYGDLPEELHPYLYNKTIIK